MNHKYHFFVIAVVAALVFAAFWAGSTSAATGCFPDTNAHWAEVFICWLKDNGITSGYTNGNYGPEDNVTRAQMAVFLQRQAEMPPSTGLIRVNSGPSSWAIYNIDPGTLTVKRFDYAVGFASSAPSVNHDFMTSPDILSGLYGRDLSLTGLEYCYFLNPNTSITKVDASYYSEASSALPQTLTPLVSDATVRGAGEGCIYYSITPQALNENSILAIKVNVAWDSSGAGVYAVLGRVTFFMQATGTLSAPPSAPPPVSSDSSDSPFALPFLIP